VRNTNNVSATPVDAVREVLLRYWDPANVAEQPDAHRTYDGWIPALWQLIDSGADESAVIAFLKEREAESMCFPALGTTRLKLPAQKLLNLRTLRRPAD
jgi:hypothetical protein